MTIRIALLIALFFLFAAAAVTIPMNAQTQGLGDRTIQRFTIREVSLFDALNKLAIDERIPIGIELKNRNHEGKSVVLNLDIKKIKLRELLALMVQQDRSYSWEVSADVINFTPVQDRDPFLAKVLATNIASFRPGSGRDKLQLRNAITELPELGKLLEAHKVSALNFGSSLTDRIAFPANVDLNCADTDVRGILNRIVRESNSKVWVLGWDSDKKDVIYLNF